MSILELTSQRISECNSIQTTLRLSSCFKRELLDSMMDNQDDSSSLPRLNMTLLRCRVFFCVNQSHLPVLALD
jgi:hypothetical protein